MEYEKHEFNETTFKQLVAKNKFLTDELQQCTQDKEFVWNLWKEMQVAHPNTANIVNSVMEREQEKSDRKAAKVLTVLQEKDQQINILQEISADLQIQLKHTNERVSELLVKESDWNKKEEDLLFEINNLKNELHSIYDQKVNKEQVDSDIENRYKDELTSLKNRIEELSGLNISLEEQLKTLIEQLKHLNSEKEELKEDLLLKNENLLSVSNQLDSISKEKKMTVGENEVLKNSLKKVKGNFKKKTKEVEEWESKVNKNLEVSNEQHEKIEQLQQEVLSLNRELKEHSNCKQTQDEDGRRIVEQANLIEKLERLQDESQNILSQQQKTFEMELNACKKTIRNLKKRINELQTKTNNEGNKDNLQNGGNNVVGDERSSTNGYEKENILLSTVDGILEEKIVLSRKDMIKNICNLKKNHQNGNIMTSSPKEKNKKTASCFLQKGTQTISPLVVTDENDFEELSLYKSKCEMLSNLVQSMETELEMTRAAHKKRLERYKFLEESCHLLCEQLSTYEAETEKAKKKIVRASMRSLQREDSKSVWNELEYYRREYDNFKFERPKLNEKIDSLRVEQSRYDTLIDKFQIEAEDFKELLYGKDREVEQMELTKQKNVSKIKSLQNEIRSCNSKIDATEKQLSVQVEAFSCKEKVLQENIQNLKSELEAFKNKQNSAIRADVETQTDDIDVDNVDKVIHDAIVDVIPDQTNSQVDSFFSVASQTYSETKQCMNNGTQTFEVDKTLEDADYEKIKESKEKKMLKLNYDELKSSYEGLKLNFEELQVRINKLKKENKKLSAEQTSLSTENEELIGNEKSSKETILNLENTVKKLKDELLCNLKALQETTSLLERKSKEMDEYSQELNIALSNEQKGKNIQKKKTKEIKSYERQLEEVTAKCSQLSFQVKTLTGENEILTDKQRTFQMRVGKLEKDLMQKKTLYDELKVKFEDAKNEVNQKQSSFESLKLKMNTAIEREKNKKIFTEELKIKIDTLTKEKGTLQDSIAILREENNRKTELLHKTQHLCHQAEVAIHEIEQIEQKPNDNKNLEITNQKCLKQLIEFKSVVSRFSEALISKISKNRNTLIELREHKKKKEMEARQNSLLANRSSSIACSILGMSTQDLVDFMSDDSSQDTRDASMIYDNDIRNKLEVILNKETNFEKVLTQFLLDLVKYNESLCEKQKEL